MNLSNNTIVILKNFSAINQSIFVRQGNVLKTMSVMKNVLAEATVEEDFPKDFAIYDLNQFLNGISLHDNPELDFSNDSYLTIREGKRKVKYFFADPSVIVSPPEKEIALPDDYVEFHLEHSQLEKLLKASNVYQLPDLAAVGENGTISMVVRDKKNDTSNEFSIVVGETNKEFTMNFKVENIKIVPGPYDVKISTKLLSRFDSKSRKLRYHIALEPDSTFSI
jgi:hypothetical protein